MKTSEASASVTTSKSTIYLLTNGVVVVEVIDNVVLDVSDLKEIVKKQGELTGNKKHPVVTIPSEFTSVTKEAREFMSGKQAAKYTLADAFIIRSLPQKILADFYIRFQKHAVPTKIFRTKEEAVKWAGKFVQK
ncbi:MAG: hypothetical protein ACOZCO_04550 [Bacteroidota bacterium]